MPDLDAAFDEVATWVRSMRWETAGVQGGTGACVPIAFTVPIIFGYHNVDARTWAASCVIRDPWQKREARIVASADDRGYWPGHMVNYLPGHRMLVDASLTTQRSITLSELVAPELLIIRGYDHRKHTRASARLGRGSIVYEVDSTNRVWRKLRWPWQELRETAARFHDEYTAGEG